MTDENRIEVWELEDEYIDRRRIGEVINIDEYCKNSSLSAKQQRELREQLELYEAAQEGIEQFVESRIDFDFLWSDIESKLPPQRINLKNLSSLPETSRRNLREWWDTVYQRSIEKTAQKAAEVSEKAGKMVEKVLLRQGEVYISDTSSASLGMLPVEVLDANGKIEKIPFVLETPLEVDKDERLVFSAVAPDKHYNGATVYIEIEEAEEENKKRKKREPFIFTEIDEEGRIELFLDLSPLGEGVQITPEMIKTRIVHSVDEEM